ncbi:MAG: hypothetical protein A2W25_12745 [candidate division Zixibacteria bacterium RBG_16_53_22]|nr:MAG: hypothetical protein A2W25_12745 [candidate division Zixibacteria bacterium RBG_16_53_22]
MEELTSVEFTSLDRRRTLIFLPVSPLEAHGSHLPLGVDYFNAVYFAERIAGSIIEKRPDHEVVIYPGIPLGASVYRLPGSVKTDAISIFKMIYYFGESLAAWGFKYIFVLSGHGSPKHIVAVESACLKVSRKHKMQMHNLSGGLAIRFLKGEFIDRISSLMTVPIPAERREVLKMDLHGGWWETSMMLLLKPELVKPEYKSLPGVMRDKKNKGPGCGYYGYPAFAGAEFAEASMKVMALEALEIIEGILDGKRGHAETLSPLFRKAVLRPYFTRYIIISLILITLAIITLVILL